MSSGAGEQRTGSDEYEYLFRNSPLPMWIANRQTLRFLDLNKAAEKLYGYPREEFLQLAVTHLRPWDTFDRIRQDYDHLASHAGQQLERRHRLASGEVIDVLVSAHGWNYKGVEANLVQVIDLTTIRRLERESAERERTFTSFLDSSLDAVIIIDENGIVTDWRGAAESIFQYTPEEAIGCLLGDLIVPPEYRQAHLEGVRRLHETGQARVIGKRLELSALRRDGVQIPIELQITRLKRRDRVVFGAFVRDLTLAKRAMDQIQRMNEELESRVAERTRELSLANEEMLAFTYTIAHDLRAPLRTIIATSRMLVEDHSQALGEEAKGYLERQVSAANRLATLIDDLLRYSRLSQQPLKKQAVDLTEMGRAIADQLLEDRGLPTDVVEVEAGLTASGDPDLLWIALTNLLDNALKFSAATPTPKVELRAVHGATVPTFVVRDNGIGLDMEYAPKIFRPFERLHRDGDYPGTGIGLANVQRIVHRHGGTIWVESAPGQGAAFHFTLP